MKSSEDWAKEIIKFLQDNPVNGIAGVTAQIEQIVGWVQNDVLKDIPRPAESIRMDA